MRPVQRANWDWATDGEMGKRERRILSSIYIEPRDEEVMNLRVLNRWKTIRANEVRYKEYFLDDADIVVVGFGTAGRIALSAVREARAEGIKVGLLRPITVSPFPYDVIDQLTARVGSFLVTEMNCRSNAGGCPPGSAADAFLSNSTDGSAAWFHSRMKSWARSAAWQRAN